MRYKGVFITGTDTGVGKSVAAACIIRALLRKGVKVGAMKPIETGCENIYGRLMPLDGTLLRTMAEMDDPVDLIVPARFAYPLAPLVAAELEDRTVDLDAIMNAYTTLSKKYEFLVVEGAGGLLVPITKRQGARGEGQEVYFMEDLIKDLQLPVVIVARATLGTINHTLLTVDHAASAGLNVIGVIINHSSPSRNNDAERTTPVVLKELCPVPVLGVLPYLDSIAPGTIDELTYIIGSTLVDLLF
ncbi:MAG: dethiobiotin synthase [Nitrospirota bacterium]